MKENPIRSLPGIPFLLGVLLVAAFAAWMFFTGIGPDPKYAGVSSAAKIFGGIALGLDRDFWQLPPSDAMLLQRKFGGLYLLAIRLRARVNVHALALAGLAARRKTPLPGADHS